MVAVVNGNAPVVELLLKRGANPNLADEYNPAQPPRSISGGSPGSSRVNFMRMLQVDDASQSVASHSQPPPRPHAPPHPLTKKSRGPWSFRPPCSPTHRARA
jgi:ankyrin repeat protein